MKLLCYFVVFCDIFVELFGWCHLNLGVLCPLGKCFELFLIFVNGILDGAVLELEELEVIVFCLERVFVYL